MVQGTNKLFCFGYGYTCDYLAHELLAQGGWSVGGTTRDPEKRAFLRARGIQAHLFDYERPLGDPYFILDGTTHLLISTPPDDMGDPTFAMHAADILRIPTLKWVGYLSTIGVYGDRDGGIVDERSEIRPNSKRGTRRVRAEAEWLSLFQGYGLPVHVFRLAGIYGPGRSALDSVRAGVARRINKPGQVFNRIHVEDIVQVLLASMAKPHPGQPYNLADDDPVPSHEVIKYACEVLGMTPPPLIPYNEADMAPITRSFYADNKRVANNLIKGELGVTLKYPDFRAGIDACLAAEQSIDMQDYLPAFESSGG
jgi:nucleoside-diphosphate-sugar epimerase